MSELTHAKRFANLLLIVLLLFAFTRCEEPDLLGTNVQPGSDKYNTDYTDTVSIIAFSERVDRLVTDELIYNLLGSCNDPMFGTTTAGFYTQLRLSGNNVNFGANPVVDSLVLRLMIKDVYGDTASTHRVRVYEVIQPMQSDSTYYSNSRMQLSGTVLADQNVVFRKKDSVLVGTQNMAPHIPIRLFNNVLGSKIINASGSTDLKDNNSFVNFIKGLYVSVEPSQGTGSIAYLDLPATLSQLSLYYHNDSASGLKYNFLINENCARFTEFNHGRYIGANPLLIKQVFQKDTLAGDSLLFLQAMAGTRVKMYFPYLKNLTSMGKIIIHKAELILRVEDFTTTPFAPPLKLSLARINEKGINEFLPDDPYPHGSSYFGGSYNSSALEYRFRLNQHIYNLINDVYEDYGLALIISGSATTASRTILHGASRNKMPLRLNITYTKIK